MQLELMTWHEVDAYLARDSRVILGTGSIEQHGPIGLIGTDAICANRIVRAAAAQADIIAAPPVSYTPAPFNTAFPGTVSLPEPLFEDMMVALFQGFAAQGLSDIYVLNGHGANLAPMERAMERAMTRVTGQIPNARIRVQSWWAYDAVNTLRTALYGDWEGMHATPSEVAITQHLTGIVHTGADAPPRALTPDFIRAHAGDRHGPPDQHRAAFPDGRVGSHSALATPQAGQQLFDAAVAAVVADLQRDASH